ncbi:hypothetical protein C1H76_4872 [Elsinoe australis]|uniref:Uncharacterized protein n=1 Tax=Elsinoe australis TaxID=40998 RepID=A0A4U7AWB9_9PEZI|nr:hypothetical protein C1H76_4872 [Elsinoe australis]
METRDYMRARCAYYEALMLIPTKEAIKAQLDNALDMLRLCRGDNCGVRSSVPSLMIQLDQDQEAYDFIKWWETDGNKSDYDWGDMDLPYLNVKGADVFEPVDWLNRRFGDLGYTTAVVLLKIKLQRDLLALKDPATLLGRVPQEIVDNIARNNVRSPIIANDKQILSASDHTALIKTLDDQIAALIRMIEKQNPFFWKILLTASPPFPPLPYSHGSKEEAQNVLRDSYGAWKDAVGAMDLVRTKLGK